MLLYKYMTNEEFLLSILDSTIETIYSIRKFAKSHDDLIHTQMWINFEDKLNEISNMDPNS